MTEVVDTTPVVEDLAATSDDDASIMTEDASPPETEDAVVPKEEQKADAFLAYILNLWAMFTCKVKEIDEDAGISAKVKEINENAGISAKVAELNEEYHVTEALNNARDATVKKAGELTESVSMTLSEWNKSEEKEKVTGEEKEWVEVDEKEQ